ncbi:hypothetical protein TA5114_03067 [Cognatishimia activa]|uniref:Lipoprotein n=2 Tax=Cognatishimia activa TaxID=1715691 RepID=A0A0N7MC52_9RHOB|nr:hypothetical protein TA5113_02917 [Cognatishimia activa]CUK27240.1 hypothetical protein TA5114_03067 [Cognatishimia activa]
MMRKTLGILLVSSIALTSCGRVADSRLNPFNWFGRAERVDVPQDEKEINPLIPQRRESIFQRRVGDDVYPGVPVLVINDVKVERVSGGAIIRVLGTAQTQGAFEVRLTPENDQELPVDGVLTYRLEAIQPEGFRQGPARSREINVARFRTEQDLTGVRTIRIVGQSNAMQVRRR